MRLRKARRPNRRLIENKIRLQPMTSKKEQVRGVLVEMRVVNKRQGIALKRRRS
jgi:hypothetical protein